MSVKINLNPGSNMSSITTTFIFICIHINFVKNTKFHRTAKPKISGRDVLPSPAPEQYWNYEEPETWCAASADCCGSRQSPIALNSKGLKPTKLQPFQFINYQNLKHPIKITNDGHTIQVLFDDLKSPPRIQGGGLNGVYNLASFRMHWGPTNKAGAEHVIDGHHFPLELQLVHIRKDFKNFEMAAKSEEPDSIAILGVLYGVDDSKPNLAMRMVTSQLKNLLYSNQTRQLRPFDLRMLLPKSTQNLFRYYGSMTEPVCNQNVVWTVFKDINYISAREMLLFRNIRYNMKDEMGIDEYMQLRNFRELQPINDRDIILGKEMSRPQSKCKPKVDDHGHSSMKLSLRNTVLKRFLNNMYGTPEKNCV